MNTLLKITIGDDGKAQFFSDYASLEDELSVQIFVRQKAEPYQGPHPDVAEDLVLWRRAKARELNLSWCPALAKKCSTDMAKTS